MHYFIKIPPHSDFPKGIFIPYATLEEAQAQAANDLLSSDFIEGIFTAEYSMVHQDDYPGHVWENKLVCSADEIKKLAPGLINKANQEALKAQEDWLVTIDRLVSAHAEGETAKLSPHDQQLSRRLGITPTNVAGRPGFNVCTGGTATAGPVALAAATAKTVIGIASSTVGAPSICEIAISFDGVTASAIPVLIEEVSGTNATNPPGTNSTSMTPKQIRGWATGSASSTGAYNWTAEPTVLEVYKKRLLSPNAGLLVIQRPLDREATAVVTAATQFKFLGIRLTAPAIINTHLDMEFDE